MTEERKRLMERVLKILVQEKLITQEEQVRALRLLRKKYADCQER